MIAGCYSRLGSEPPTVSIVCFNRLDQTRRCLESLLHFNPEARLIVTDNASTDGTGAYLARLARSNSNVVVVSNSENLGFQGPHENAFRLARDFKPRPLLFCVLNNDVILGPDWWRLARQAMKDDPKLAIVGSANGVCSQLRPNFDGMPGPCVEYVEGSLMVIRVRVIVELGLFSPHLRFMYGEDSDLSLRVREAGYTIRLLQLGCRHLRCQTVKNVDPLTRLKIEAAKRENHAYLQKRWQIYLRRRGFDYRVKISRSGAIGDVIDVTAVIAAIRQRWPMSLISVQTECAEVFKGNPHVRFAGANIQGQFDYNYDLNLSYEKRPDLHTIQAYLLDSDNPAADWRTLLPGLYPSFKDHEQAEELLGDPDRPWVAIHAAVSWIGKTWPIVRWHELLSYLKDMGFCTVLFGTDPTWPIHGTLDLRGRTSLPVMASIMDDCEFFVGIDSAPSHVAQAVGCPAVVLFGTVLAERKLFPAANAIGVQASVVDAPCVGLHHRLPPPVTFSTCAGDCMKAITVEQVRKAIKQIDPCTKPINTVT